MDFDISSYLQSPNSIQVYVIPSFLWVVRLPSSVIAFLMTSQYNTNMHMQWSVCNPSNNLPKSSQHVRYV